MDSLERAYVILFENYNPRTGRIEPSHAARRYGSRRLGGNLFESKCGRWLRIVHKPEQLEGKMYGRIVRYYDSGKIGSPWWPKTVGVQKAVVGDRKITVYWNKAFDEEDLYNVYYNIYIDSKNNHTLPYPLTKLDFEPLERITHVQPEDATAEGFDYKYTISGLEANTEYAVAVRAEDREGKEDINRVEIVVRTPMLLRAEPYVQAVGPLETQEASVLVEEGTPNLTIRVEWSGSDLDLHVYDPEGRHIGHNYETDRDEVEVENAYYSGWKAEPEWVVVGNPQPGIWGVRIVSRENVEVVSSIKTTIDNTGPTSSVLPPASYWQNRAPFPLSAVAVDDLGGVRQLILWYRYSTDNTSWGDWRKFGVDNQEPWGWDFSAPEGDGYYEFFVVAEDFAGNVEEKAKKAEACCGLDTVKPVSSVNPIEYWQLRLPFEISVSATDPRAPNGALPSGVSKVELLYRYSLDNLKWSDWKFAGIEIEKWAWSFGAPDGYGFYQFSSISTDAAGNVEELPEIPDAEICAVIPARVDFDPDTLNLKSEGRWITVYIQLPSGYPLENIPVSSICLEGQGLFTPLLPAEDWPWGIGDYDLDGKPEMMVKFSREAIEEILQHPGEYEVTFFGNWGRIPFRGKDTIRVICPPESGKKVQAPPGASHGRRGEERRSKNKKHNE